MTLKPEDFIALLTNVGFPVTMCFILLRYVLQTIGEKVDKLSHSVETMIQLMSMLGKRDASSKDSEEDNI